MWRTHWCLPRLGGGLRSPFEALITLKECGSRVGLDTNARTILDGTGWPLKVAGMNRQSPTTALASAVKGGRSRSTFTSSASPFALRVTSSTTVPEATVVAVDSSGTHARITSAGWNSAWIAASLWGISAGRGTGSADGAGGRKVTATGILEAMALPANVAGENFQSSTAWTASSVSEAISRRTSTS